MAVRGPVGVQFARGVGRQFAGRAVALHTRHAGFLTHLVDLRLRPGAAQRPPRRSQRSAFHRTASADPRSDAQLRDRIEARLGRLVSHPRAIDVRVHNGVVRLSGDVLQKERDGLLLQVREMAGVQKLVNAMTAHQSPAGIAGVQTREEPVLPL